MKQTPPVITPELRAKAPGTVKVVFVVDEEGRVQYPLVSSSSDPVFEQAALEAVRQWRFEPGRRDGKPVATRMRVPLTFPKESGER